ncbi:MAG: hypothetical protein ACFFC7_12660 [Candidatus Hermodarchaeota archaeon]
MNIIELPAPLALFLMIVIPLLAIGLSLLISFLSKRKNGKVSNFLAYLINPITLEPLNPAPAANISEEEDKTNFLKQLSLRLFLVYGAIVLFLGSSIIAEFYHILTDVTVIVTQGSTGLARSWRTVVIDTPFSGGWYGSFPWYGQFPFPPINLDIFHRPWSWVLFMNGISDNPQFFMDHFVGVIFRAFLFGLIFLLPLGIRAIRESFIPSLFFFTTSMFTISRAFLGCFSQAWNLEFGAAIIQIGHWTITKGMGQIPEMTIILGLLPFIVVIYGVFIFLGNKLWRIHYPDNQISRLWFFGYITVSYWLSLVLIILLV